MTFSSVSIATVSSVYVTCLHLPPITGLTLGRLRQFSDQPPSGLSPSSPCPHLLDDVGPGTASNGMQRRRRASRLLGAGGSVDDDVEAAKPESPRWGHRLRLAARGHPLAVAAAAAVVLTLAVSVGGWVAWHAAVGAPASPGSFRFVWGGRHRRSPVGLSALPAGVPLTGFPDVVAHRLLSPAAVAARHPPLPGGPAKVGATEKPPALRKKIVGLVEARNALRALPFFLSALSSVVDSVVLLDDVSTDASVAFLAAHGGTLGVELLLTKTGGWVREELRDRSILLAAGRLVGGTHFVLLDYDEVFAHGCAADGSLRLRIAGLRPGGWLSLPWIEAWHSASVARVRPDDPDMNFLTRRQVVVFADDGTVSYDMASSLSRQLSAGTLTDPSSGRGGAAPRPATIHSLRCPRSLCPSPPVYHAPPWPAQDKSLHGAAPDGRCGVVELRFLNLENVLLKSAWYEALAVRNNASAAVSRGKMIDALFGGSSGSGDGGGSGGAGNGGGARITTRPVAGASVAAYPLWASSVYDVVDTWRAQEVVTWTMGVSRAVLDSLPALSRVDVGALRAALEAPTVDVAAEGDAIFAAACAAVEALGTAAGAGGAASANTGGRPSPLPLTMAMPPGLLHYVPRRLRGELHLPTLVVIAAASPAVRTYASRLLRAMGGFPIVLPSPDAAPLPACGGGGAPDEQSYELRRAAVEPALRALGAPPAGDGGLLGLTFVAPPVRRLACELSDVLARELADVHVVYLVLSTGGGGVGDVSPAFASATDVPTDVDDLPFAERVAAIAALSRDRWAPAAASVGSPHTLLSLHVDALLSLGGAAALASTLQPAESSPAVVDWRAVLGVVEAENRHQRRRRASAAGARPTPPLPPVARLLFSINCGRSGSRYLAGLLGTVAGVRVALHEPPCPAGACSGGGGMPMQQVRLADSYAMRRDVKLPMIRAALAETVAAALALGGGGVADRLPAAAATAAAPFGSSCGGGEQPHLYSLIVVGAGARHARGMGAGGDPAAAADGKRGSTCLVWQPVLYAETNPNFKAWFYDVVLDGLAGDGGYDVDVLHIRKYLPAVVKSLYETGYFTVRDGTTWMETGDGVNALVRPPPPDPTAAAAGVAASSVVGRRQAAALDTLLSYAINAEAVGRFIAARYASVRGVHFTDARAEVLYGSAGATALVRGLGLTPTSATLAAAGVRVDKYEGGDGGGGRHKRGGHLPLAVAVAATDRYLDRCAAAGIAVPRGMVHLQRVNGFAYPE